MATTVLEAPEVGAGERGKLAVIDCDIHNTMSSSDVWLKYLSEQWQAYHRNIGGRGRLGSPSRPIYWTVLSACNVWMRPWRWS